MRQWKRLPLGVTGVTGEERGGAGAGTPRKVSGFKLKSGDEGKEDIVDVLEDLYGA